MSFSAAPEHVVAVGGGLEPITAIGRAVVLISQDGGRGWTRADGLDVPRMTQIGRSADARALLATSDPDPATGTTTWQSVDGGRRWTPTTESLPPPERVDRGRDRFGWPAVRRGEVAVSVGDFGVIERLADGRWTTVRHLDATPAVLMVADRPVDLPWAIIGRHSLCSPPPRRGRSPAARTTRRGRRGGLADRCRFDHPLGQYVVGRPNQPAAAGLRGRRRSIAAGRRIGHRGFADRPAATPARLAAERHGPVAPGVGDDARSRRDDG